MIQKIKQWLRSKEAALDDKQRLRLLIGLYALLLLLCAVLVYTAWESQSAIPVL